MFGFLALLTQEKAPPRNSGFCFTETMNNNCINEKTSTSVVQEKHIAIQKKTNESCFLHAGRIREFC